VIFQQQITSRFLHHFDKKHHVSEAFTGSFRQAFDMADVLAFCFSSSSALVPLAFVAGAAAARTVAGVAAFSLAGTASVGARGLFPPAGGEVRPGEASRKI